MKSCKFAVSLSLLAVLSVISACAVHGGASLHVDRQGERTADGRVVVAQRGARVEAENLTVR